MSEEKRDEVYGVKALAVAIDIKNPELVHKLAEVALVPAAEVAKLGATAIRLLALPFRAAEAYGERLLATIKKAEAQVPPERQLEPAPSIAGPILDNVKHLEAGNPLLELYENLLARAMDRDRVNEAHPAFPKIIEQLSPDEAKLLVLTRATPIVRKSEDHDYTDGKEPRRVTVREDSTATEQLMFPQHAHLYVARLQKLSLLSEFDIKFAPNPMQPATDERGEFYRHSVSVQKIGLTEFGDLFARACLPPAE